MRWTSTIELRLPGRRTMPWAYQSNPVAKVGTAELVIKKSLYRSIPHCFTTGHTTENIFRCQSIKPAAIALPTKENKRKRLTTIAKLSHYAHRNSRGGSDERASDARSHCHRPVGRRFVIVGGPGRRRLWGGSRVQVQDG